MAWLKTAFKLNDLIFFKPLNVCDEYTHLLRILAQSRDILFLHTPVCGAAGRCPCPGTEGALGIRGTAAGVTGRGGWGYNVSGGMMGTC